MVERALTLHERITPTPVTAVIFVGWLPACFVHWHCDYDRIRSLIMMIIFMMMTIENNLWLTSPMLATLSTPFWVWKTILRVFTRDGSVLRKRFSRNLSIGRQTFRKGIIFYFTCMGGHWKVGKATFEIFYNYSFQQEIAGPLHWVDYRRQRKCVDNRFRGEVVE